MRTVLVDCPLCGMPMTGLTVKLGVDDSGYLRKHVAWACETCDAPRPVEGPEAAPLRGEETT